MSTPRRNPTAARRGFTLVEAIAAMTIIGVLGSLTSQLVLRAAQSYSEAATRAQLHAEISSALDRIDKEFRQIAIRTPYASVAPGIEAVSATGITWLDGGTQRSIAAAGGSLTYFDQSSNTTSTLIGSTSSLSIAVAAFDETGTAITLPAAGSACDGIRRLSLTITATRSGMTESLRTRVYLRCTMQGATP